MAEIVVDEAALDIDPRWVDPDQPLVGRGLELDSLDVIELLMAVEAEYDIELPDDDASLFGSINTLTDRVLGLIDQER